MKDYQHPVTFQSTGDLSTDFQYAIEDYELNVAPFLPLDRSVNMIDVGCGWGQFLWWLKSKGYTNVQGIDLGGGQIQQCHSLQIVAEQVTDSTGWLEQHTEQFDVVTMHHLIEHVDAQEGLRLLRAARQALRPNGLIIVQTPNMNATSANFSRYIELTHVTGYTDSSLAEAMKLSGFANVTVHGNKTPVHLNLRRLLWLSLQWASRLAWRAMLFAELGSDAPRILSKNIYAVGYRVA